MAGLAGCLGGGGSNAPLEVLHGWTGGDGKQAVNNLTETFESEHSEVNTEFKPVGGGGNTNLNTVVSNRLSNDNPPSAFAGWPGNNLTQYEGVLGSISDVWEGDLADAHVQEARELSRYDGEYRAMPIGSHRLNNLFYNVSVVEEAGVDPASLESPSALLDALDAVARNTDKAPMAHAMKAPWTTLQLFGAVLLSTRGFDDYMTVVDGEGGKAAVREAFETTQTVLSEYVNDDAASIGFTSANQKIMNGEAAFIHQGNWAAGAFRNKEDFAYDEDWGATAFPGTEGQYTLHIDSFIYPGDNPSPEKTKTWMEFAGSERGQIAFNRYKGSIPTRPDVSTERFGPYLEETIDDFANADRKPPTLAHGLAVVPSTLTGLKGVITDEFSGPYDVESATQSVIDTIQG